MLQYLKALLNKLLLQRGLRAISGSPLPFCIALQKSALSSEPPVKVTVAEVEEPPSGEIPG